MRILPPSILLTHQPFAQQVPAVGQKWFPLCLRPISPIVPTGTCDLLRHWCLNLTSPDSPPLNGVEEGKVYQFRGPVFLGGHQFLGDTFVPTVLHPTFSPPL